MFDPKALTEYAVQNPRELVAHIVAYASYTVIALASLQRILRGAEDWARQWFPNWPLAGWLNRAEYGVSALSDLAERVALNWRDKIAPKPAPSREVWDDAKRQVQLSEKASPATAGK